MADDDRDHAMLFERVLRKEYPHLKISYVQDGQQLMQFLHLGQVDLLFLDLNMPLMDGRQFLIEIKKHITLKDIPVIILSTSSDRTIVNEMKQLGAKDFITKPDRYSEWESVLKKYLQRAV